MGYCTPQAPVAATLAAEKVLHLASTEFRYIYYSITLAVKNMITLALFDQHPRLSLHRYQAFSPGAIKPFISANLPLQDLRHQGSQKHYPRDRP